MSFELVLIILLVVILIIVIRGHRKSKERLARELRTEIRDLKFRNGSDRRAFLDLILRDLGRLLIHKDRQMYSSLVYGISEEISELELLTTKAQLKKFNQLCEKYPTYEYFADFKGWPHLQDCDAFYTQFYHLAEIYRDIRIFIALKGLTDEYWSKEFKVSGDELTHLQKYIKNLEDTELLAALTEAERIFSWLKYDVERKDYLHYDKYHYLTPDFGFRYADYHPATNDVLVWVRALGEYGVISKSDGYTSFYRLDTEQDELVELDPLFEATKTVEVSRIIRWDEH